MIDIPIFIAVLQSLLMLDQHCKSISQINLEFKMRLNHVCHMCVRTLMSIYI